ncbi:MAG: hypothetical protein JOY71_01310, partial [Acetobacteraceae bacterium]|nr:hypothetical protein [Acetobacteraceae bacterium]
MALVAAALVGQAMAVVAAELPAASSCGRIRGVLRDAALGKSWLLAEQCKAPAGPWVALAADKDADAPNAKTDAASQSSSYPHWAVLAGGKVRLYKWDRNARIDLSGVALQSGAAGAAIR